MYQRYHVLRRISKIMPRILPANHINRSYSAFSVITVPNTDYSKISNTSHFPTQFDSHRYYSTISNESTLAPGYDDLLTFMKYTFSELQGTNHCWLNKVDDEGDKDWFKKDGVFLVLAGQLVKNSQVISMVEKIKSLQQRFPQLNIIGFHCGSDTGFADDRSHLVELIMKEYITFPVLLSNKNFLQMENGACYILFKDFRNPVVFHDKDENFEILNKAIQELLLQETENIDSSISSSRSLKRTWVKQTEAVKEPYFSSFLQNILLYFPGCVSADESGDRLFLSDSNHHRIIIFDGSGRIIDSV